MHFDYYIKFTNNSAVTIKSVQKNYKIQLTGINWNPTTGVKFNQTAASCGQPAVGRLSSHQSGWTTTWRADKIGSISRLKGASSLSCCYMMWSLYHCNAFWYVLVQFSTDRCDQIYEFHSHFCTTESASFCQHWTTYACSTSDFYCAMLCISAVYAGMRCLSVSLCVCVSHSWVAPKRIKIFSKFFHHRVAKPF